MELRENTGFRASQAGQKVFVKAVEKCSKEELILVIQGKVLESSVIHPDCWKAYYGLIVNGIENFWSFAKRRP